MFKEYAFVCIKICLIVKLILNDLIMAFLLFIKKLPALKRNKSN